MTPFIKGGKVGLSAVPAWAKRCLFRSLSEMWQRNTAGIPYLPALASALREGNELYHEMKESGVLAKTALVFGQMNEVPGARARVGLTGLTMAEYFRDEGGKDVLLFMDNIFRFIQAGSEVSALLGRVPSAVGYQPTLAEEMGQLRNASLPRTRAPSLPCRRCMCRRTTLPTRRRQTHLRIWILPWCFPDSLHLSAFIRLLIRWNPIPPLLIRISSVRSTIASRWKQKYFTAL